MDERREPDLTSKNSNSVHLSFEQELWQAADDDSKAFEVRIAHLTAGLHGQMVESAKVDQLILANLEEIGYGV